MGKLTITEFVTLDGVMQGPGGPDEDRSGGFEHGGWSFGYWDDEMLENNTREIGRGAALLLGRTTYEIFAGYWPKMPDEDRIAAKFNRMPKYVASTTLHQLGWAGSELLRGDVPAAVRQLKQRIDGDIQVIGSGVLVQTLNKHGLVEEYNIWTFPVVLGTGKKLFEEAAPGGLRLVRSNTSSTGVTMNTYRTGEQIQGGSFLLPENEPSRAR